MYETVMPEIAKQGAHLFSPAIIQETIYVHNTSSTDASSKTLARPSPAMLSYYTFEYANPSTQMNLNLIHDISIIKPLFDLTFYDFPGSLPHDPSTYRCIEHWLVLFLHNPPFP